MLLIRNPSSGEMLSSWFTERATEIEELSGQVCVPSNATIGIVMSVHQYYYDVSSRISKLSLIIIFSG